MRLSYSVPAILAISALLGACSEKYPSPDVPDNLVTAEKVEKIDAAARVDTASVKMSKLKHYDPFLRAFRHVIYYDTADHELSYDDKKALDDLISRAEKYSDYEVVVRGHTDRVGTERSNDRLSENRAQGVVDYLISKSIPSGKIASEALSERERAVLGVTKWADKMNRRVEVLLRLPEG